MGSQPEALDWTANKVRHTFMSFFQGKGHEEVPSSPVVPHNDPTLLFANAGMNQFKPIFLGIVDPNSPLSKLKRAYDTQNVVVQVASTMILMMLVRTLTTILSLRCLVIGHLGIISRKRPLDGPGNSINRYIDYQVSRFMPLILGVMKNLTFQRIMKLEIYGLSSFPLTGCCLSAAKTSFGRWVILDLVDPAPKYTLIELGIVMLHHLLIMMIPL